MKKKDFIVTLYNDYIHILLTLNKSLTQINTWNKSFLQGYIKHVEAQRYVNHKHLSMLFASIINKYFMLLLGF